MGQWPSFNESVAKRSDPDPLTRPDNQRVNAQTLRVESVSASTTEKLAPRAKRNQDRQDWPTAMNQIFAAQRDGGVTQCSVNQTLRRNGDSRWVASALTAKEIDRSSVA